FDADGTITAGNAPGVNDGACAFVVMSDKQAADMGKTAMATILGHAEIAVEAKDFPKTPGLVINQLLEKTGYKKDDIDLFEINEEHSQQYRSPVMKSLRLIRKKSMSTVEQLPSAIRLGLVVP